MADTPYPAGTKVTARKYIVEREGIPAGTVGTVDRLNDKEIFVDWGPQVGIRSMRASHLKVHRDGEATSQAPTNRPVEASPESSAERALDPDAREITDGDVDALRQPPERQRHIDHLLHPEAVHDPAEHGQLQISEGAAKRRSLDDLRTYHRNAHKHPGAEQPHAL